MKRTPAAVLGLVALLAVPVTAFAQEPFVFFGGGGTLPIGDFGDAAGIGWMGSAGLGVSVGGQGAMVGVEVFYGQNSLDVGNESVKLPGAMGWVGYRIGETSRPGPYVFGGAGALRQSVAGFSETMFAYGGGVGVDIPAGAVSVYVEGRFIGATKSGNSTNFIPVMAGVSIPLKRNAGM